MGESFWQNNSLVTHILFELQPIMISCPVANFGNHPLNQASNLGFQTMVRPSLLGTVKVFIKRDENNMLA